MKEGTYQVQVFAGLAEKEALHAVLLGLVYNMMERGIATSAYNIISYCKLIHGPLGNPDVRCDQKCFIQEAQ